MRPATSIERPSAAAADPARPDAPVPARHRVGFRTARVLLEAGRLYAAYWPVLAPIAFCLYAALALLPPLFAVMLGSYAAASVPFFYLAGAFWLQGALVTAVHEVRSGREDVGIRETLERVWPKVNTLSAAGLVAAAGIYAAWSSFVVPSALVFDRWALAVVLPLLLVPGLVLLSRWILVVPAIMLENAGLFRAFRRSPALVSGYGRSALALVAVTVFVLFTAWLAAFVIVEIAGRWLPERAVETGVLTGAANLVAFSLATPFAALAWSLLYYELHIAHRPRKRYARTSLRVGDALDVAWNAYQRDPERYLVLAGVVFGLIAPAAFLLTPIGFHSLSFTLAVTVFGTVLLQRPLAVALTEPRLLSHFDLLSALWPRLPILIAAVVLAGAAFGAGAALDALADLAVLAAAGGAAARDLALGVILLAALAPAVLFLAYGTLVAPAIASERVGPLAALRVSTRLVAGNTRGALVVLGVTIVIAVAIASFVAGLLPPVQGRGWDALIAVSLNVLTAPYVALAWTLTYFQLRDMSETRPRAASNADAATVG